MLNTRQSFPLNYSPYFLEDLVEECVYKMGPESYYDDEMTEQENAVSYARILFLIGDYQRALKHLLSHEFQVEATSLAIALREV